MKIPPKPGESWLEILGPWVGMALAIAGAVVLIMAVGKFAAIISGAK